MRGSDPLDDYTIVELFCKEMNRLENVLELSGVQIPTVVFPTEYAFLGVPNKELSSGNTPFQHERTAVFLDRKTGDVTKTVTPEFQAEFIAPASDGFVIAGQNEIAKYDSSGNCQTSIQTPFPMEKNSFFEENGKYYVIGGLEDEERSFYSVDFANGTISEMATLSELKLVTVDPCRNYAFKAKREYKVDFESRQHVVESVKFLSIRMS